MEVIQQQQPFVSRRIADNIMTPKTPTEDEAAAAI
jgi:hypothetical protein